MLQPPAGPTGSLERIAAGKYLEATPRATTRRMVAAGRYPAGKGDFRKPERRWTVATDIADLPGAEPGDLLGYRPRLRYVLIGSQKPQSSGSANRVPPVEKGW